jgi:hypothetical protein
MLNWLILGGGIHGVHIAARLVGEAGVPLGRLRILDPGAHLLERWKACPAAAGMRHLRSTAVHHLDRDPSSLDRFAGMPQRQAPDLFAHACARPSLDLFNGHCDHLFDSDPGWLGPLLMRASSAMETPKGGAPSSAMV